MLKTGKRENDVVFCFCFKCTQDNTAVASKSRMSDNQSWLLGGTVSIN